jgi:hypothetical protein
MIALTQAALIILTAFIRMRLAYLGFVFLLPFMPRYLGIAVGNGSFTARRIIIIFFILLFVTWLTQRHKFNEMIKLILRNWGLITAVVFLFIVKIISTCLNAGVGNLLYVGDDFLASMPIIFMTMMLIRSDDTRQSLLVAIVAGLFVSELLSIVEFIKQTPLLVGSVEFNVEGAEEIEAGKFRDDKLRTAALFDNPLLLSEFVCISWPLSLYLYQYANSRILRTLAFFALILAPVTLFFVNSRSGWLIFFLTVIYMWLSFLWIKMDKTLRLVTGGILVVLSLIAIVGIIDVFQSPEKYFSRRESEGISALERINQYSVVSTAFSERPLLGYGTQQNVAEDLDFLNHMDNYWLKLIIESGLFGIVTFAIMLFLLLKKMSKLKRLAISVYDKKLLFALMSSLMAFSVNLLFLSMPSNNIYFFIIAGLVVGWTADKKQLTPIQQ